MSTLYIDRSGLELTVAAGALELREDGALHRRIPLRMIERLVIRGNIALDTGVLQAVADAGIALLTLSPRQQRRVSIHLGPPHQDARTRLAQTRAALQPEQAAAFARSTLTAKARAQKRALAAVAHNRSGHACVRALDMLEKSGEGLAACSRIESMRGIEGAMARAYFQGLEAVLPPALGFSGRNRRPPRDPVNACLSLGYTLIHFEAVRELYACGLDPYIGFLHELSHGRESLACDLVEPLRPRWDGFVVGMFRTQTLREQDFNRSESGCLLGKAGRSRFYAEYEAWAPAARRWLRRAARELTRTLRQTAPEDA